jgi:RNA polymerase sigma factor (sigma-70 family)
MPTKKTNNFKNSEVLDLLKAENHAMLKEFYVVMYPKVQDFILLNAGTPNDARDIFQDALVLFLRKIQNMTSQLVQNVKWGQYFMGIVHKIWLLELKNRKKREIVALSEMPELLELDHSELNLALTTQEWRLDVVHKALHQLPPGCRELLNMFYVECAGTKEIAERLGYTESFIRIKKLRCLQKLKKAIHQYSQNPLNHEYP